MIILDAPEPEDQPSKPLHPFLWWELMRVPFNFILMIGSEVSMLLIRLFANVEEGKDAVEPITWLFVLFFANIFYTYNWIAELGNRKSGKERLRIFKNFNYGVLAFIFLSPVVNFFYMLVRLIKGML
ncbi:MAG: hypothetical protein AAFO07_16740 [Bacteroidota bacterium]